MLVLAVDTCLGACSAAVDDGLGHISAISEIMTKGHQERLALMVRDTMAAARAVFSALDRIAVTIGPGSFTGLRVGLAFAKGLALALERPCVGVGTLEALAFSVDSVGWRVAAIDAGRGQIYLQIFNGGHAVTAPDVLPGEIAAARVMELVGGGHPILIGPGAAELAKALPVSRAIDIAGPSPQAVARLGARAGLAPARPLYLRAPDAKVKVR